MRLHHLDARLQISLLRRELQQHVALAFVELLLRQIEAPFRGALEVARGAQRIGVVLQRAQRVGDVLHRADHRAAIGPRRGLVGVARALELMQQGAGVEYRLRRVAGELPGETLRRDQGGKDRIGVAAVGADGEVRQRVGGGDADLGAGGVQLLFRGAHVRALLDQLRRQAHRQIERQMQVGEPEGLARSFARIGAGQRRQEVALLRQRLAQRRQGRLGLRQRRCLHGDIAAVAQAVVQPALQEVEHFAVDRDQLIGGLDLAAQRGLGDRRDHHVRCQRQIGRLDFEALHVGERLQRFHRAPIEAPDVERVGDLQLRGIEIVDVGAGRRRPA